MLIAEKIRKNYEEPILSHKKNYRKQKNFFIMIFFNDF